MSAILSRIVKETDLAAIEKMVVVKRRTLGPKYDRYKERVIEVLGSKYPSAIAGLDTVELKQIITVVDIIGVESHGMMKRLGGACTGCGWCCSQTAGIIVTAEDAERISREVKKKKEDLFSFDGREWSIKSARPCQWWNPRNGRCTIYNLRPRTCRSWPLGVNEQGKSSLVAEADCNYSVGVLAYKVLGALAVAERSSPPADPG